MREFKSIVVVSFMPLLALAGPSESTSTIDVGRFALVQPGKCNISPDGVGGKRLSCSNGEEVWIQLWRLPQSQSQAWTVEPALGRITERLKASWAREVGELRGVVRRSFVREDLPGGRILLSQISEFVDSGKQSFHAYYSLLDGRDMATFLFIGHGQVSEITAELDRRVRHIK